MPKYTRFLLRWGSLYTPVFRPDPKRFCDVGLVAPVEEVLGQVLLSQLQPEDGVDGPGLHPKLAETAFWPNKLSEKVRKLRQKFHNKSA